MSIQLTEKLKSLASQIDKEPQLILRIQGSRYTYSTAGVFETAKWDDPRIHWDNEKDITWDGLIEREDSRSYISLKGTTRSIGQTLLVDKGGSGSVSVINIALVDIDKSVGEDLSFNQIGEPLGKAATVYLSLKGAKFPQDAIPLFRGFVDDLK